MHLEQVNAFYDFVASHQEVYEQYYNGCCIRGVFGVWNWDKKKIVDFAASLGFTFTESELDYVLFDSGAGAVQHVSAY
jgi:Nif11 domain